MFIYTYGPSTYSQKPYTIGVMASSKAVADWLVANYPLIKGAKYSKEGNDPVFMALNGDKLLKETIAILKANGGSIPANWIKLQKGK